MSTSLLAARWARHKRSCSQCRDAAHPAAMCRPGLNLFITPRRAPLGDTLPALPSEAFPVRNDSGIPSYCVCRWGGRKIE